MVGRFDLDFLGDFVGPKVQINSENLPLRVTRSQSVVPAHPHAVLIGTALLVSVSMFFGPGEPGVGDCISNRVLRQKLDYIERVLWCVLR
jgi:hypothetical protein